MTIHPNYQVFGPDHSDSVPLILLMHGAGGDLHHFKTVTPVLRKAGFRILLVDVRFHGLSQCQDDTNEPSFDFQDVINDLCCVIKELKEKYYQNQSMPLYVGGLSMGGMISLLYASSKGDQWNGVDLKGIILLAAGIPYMEVDRPGWQAFFSTTTVTPEILQNTKQAIISSSLDNPKEVQRAMNLISDTRLLQVLVAIANVLPFLSIPPKEYQLLTTVPMLLLMPDQDPYTKIEMELLHECNVLHHVKSTAMTIENSGHMVIIDQGPRVGQCMVDFIQQNQ